MLLAGIHKALGNTKDSESYYLEFIKYPDKLLKQYSATSILVTQKDIVKMKDFVLPISLLNLEYVLPDSTLLKIIKKSSTTRSKNTSK